MLYPLDNETRISAASNGRAKREHILMASTCSKFEWGPSLINTDEKFRPFRPFYTSMTLRVKILQ